MSKFFKVLLLVLSVSTFSFVGCGGPEVGSEDQGLKELEDDAMEAMDDATPAEVPEPGESDPAAADPAAADPAATP